MERKGNNGDDGAVEMETLAEFRAREQEVQREWQWLHGALNAVARVRAENGDAQASGSPPPSISDIQCLRHTKNIAAVPKSLGAYFNQ